MVGLRLAVIRPTGRCWSFARKLMTADSPLEVGPAAVAGNRQTVVVVSPSRTSSQSEQSDEASTASGPHAPTAASLSGLPHKPGHPCVIALIGVLRSAPRRYRPGRECVSSPTVASDR